MRRRKTNPLILLASLIALAIGAWFNQDDRPAQQTPVPQPRVETRAPQPSSQPETAAPAAESASASSLAQLVPDDVERRELEKTLELIQRGGPFPHRQDGAVFQNRERRLPQQPRGYYHEYTVRTPGASNRGARRVVRGDGGELYYTRDHYGTFMRIDR
jgi:guanyl-specific ribonuclease Sa